ncbi:MAG: ATP phosphoribosyltransferase regulatory subunit, partial [Clostridia bacterium]|nr:ATP phosphoribosyltransferase regulatory subunit [Clostridia bacterium]
MKGWRSSMFDQSILKPNEKAVFSMRDMFVKSGYKRFKMSKFEEYDLYSKNKEFLVSDQIITFTDTNGKLLALKPDVTLSIIKNTKFDREGVQKYYYDENVYRASENGGSYKEILQTGLECMGNIS